MKVFDESVHSFETETPEVLAAPKNRPFLQKEQDKVIAMQRFAQSLDTLGLSKKATCLRLNY